MGFTGLARWMNAPPSGLELVKMNIRNNHSGIDRGRWFLSVRSYRSTFSPNGSFHSGQERSLCALTMNNSVFVLIEDPAAPTRAEFLAAQAQVEEQSRAAAEAAAASSAEDNDGTASQNPPPLPLMVLQEQPHYRNTFLTLSPPGALEQLLTQLRARWLSTRQPLTTTARSQAQNAGHQLVIDGNIFSIGTDWLVRVGNVILAGGAVKGMLLEAEYLPLPVIHPQSPDETPELLSNLLTSILPNVPNARTVAVTISDAQWEDVLWKRSDPDDEEHESREDKDKIKDDDDDDVYVYEDEDDEPSNYHKGDWVGVERDRRSAFLIVGALKSEGIL